MSINVRGIAKLNAILNAVPRRLQGATRNAINRSLTFARKEAVNDINAKLGINKKTTRGKLKIIRAKQGEAEGRIVADNTPLPMNQYQMRINPVSPTQATVYVKDSLDGAFRRSKSSFVNPLFNESLPFRRAQGVNRLPIAISRGPSIAVQYQDYIDKYENYANAIGDFYRKDFERQLRRILKR